MANKFMVLKKILNSVLVLSLILGASGFAGCKKKKVDAPSDAAVAADPTPVPGVVATVTGISPSSGAIVAGTLVTISGTNFVSGATVTIGGVPCTNVTVVNSTTITCTTGDGTAGSGDVVVTNPGTTGGSLPGGFSYVSTPTVSTISPNVGPLVGGTAVTITGSAFAQNATVTIGGIACTTVVVNATGTSLACVTGASAAQTDVAVTASTPGGNSGSLVGAYTYRAKPTPTSVAPTTLTTYGGASITITGTGFLAGMTAAVGGSSCTSLVVNSSTSATCTAPASLAAGGKDIITTNTDAQNNTLANGLTYQSILVIAQDTPSDFAGTIINPSTGVLTTIPKVAMAGAPKGVAIHPTLKIAYAAYASNVVHFSINASTGALASTGAAVAGPSVPSALVVTPSGKFVYASKNGPAAGTSGITLFTVDQVTGLLTAGATATSTGVGAVGLAVTPDEKYLYVVYNGNSLVGAFSINSGTGVLTLVAVYDTGANPRAVAVDPQSKYAYTVHYAAGGNFVRFFSITTTSGALSAIADYTLPGAATGSTGIAVTSGCLFVTNDTANTLSSFIRSAIDGTLSSSASYALAAASVASGIGVDPTNAFAYIANYGPSTILKYAILGGCTLSAAGGSYTTDLTNPLGFAFTVK